MTENSTVSPASTAELADLRPPGGGEYFYTDMGSRRCYHAGGSSSATCFVCEKKGHSSYDYYYINAAAQCLAAGIRISAMFKPEACYGPIPAPEGGVCVIISACEAHRYRAEILCRLTMDGVITLDRVSRAMMAQISRSEFHELVAKEARAIWDSKEGDRRDRNWRDAWNLSLERLHRIPSLAERTALAQFLWQKRKEGQASEDWFEAEKKVSALYSVNQSS